MTTEILRGLVLIFIALCQVSANAKLTHSFDNLSKAVANQELNLIGVGETHREQNKKQLYLELLTKLQIFFNKPFCLLIEAPEGDSRPYSDGWPIREAVAMNIAVFRIDKPHVERRYDRSNSYIELLNERDKYMADKIFTLFKSKTCRSALLINGANHYRNSADSRVSLRRWLQGNSLLKPHFILRLDNEFFSPNGATEWNWLPGKSEDFDSVLFGTNLFER